MSFPKTTRYGADPLDLDELANKRYVDAQSHAGLDLTTLGDLHGFSTVDARIPIGTDGQHLEADSGEALGLKWANAGHDPNYQMIIKSTDETINSDTTLQDDDELTATLIANTRHYFALGLYFETTSAPDFKYSLTFPTGTTNRRLVGNWNGAIAEAIAGDLAIVQSPIVPAGGERAIALQGYIITSGTAGALTLQWAQNTSDVADTTVKAGATLQVWRI